MQVSTSACGTWRSDWYFLLFSTWYELLLHGLSESQQGVSWSDFWVSKSLFRVSQSGVRVSQSPRQSFTIRFPSFTMQVSQYDLQVSEYNLQVSQSKFQNPFSTFRNPIAKFHNPTLTCLPRVSQGFLWISWWFLAFFFRFHLVHVQSFCKVSFRFLSMFLARLFHGVLMRFSYNFFAGFFWFSCTVSFKFLAGFLTVSFWHAFFRQLSPIEARNSGTTDPIFAPLRATYKNT